MTDPKRKEPVESNVTAPAVEASSFFDRSPPPQYLDEWIGRLAQPAEQIAQDLLSFLIFRLGDEYVAVQASELAELTLPQPIHVIPHRTSDVVLGLVNIRGQLRICVSLHGLLGISAAAPRETPEADAEQRMLILEKQSQQWVFPVEQVLGVIRLPAAELRTIPSTFGKVSAFSQAIFTWQGHTVGYLDEAQITTALRNACK